MPAEAQSVPARDPATGSALLGAYLSQGTNLTTLMMSLSTASVAGMFALVDKAVGLAPLGSWVIGVLGFGIAALSSYRVLELDKMLVKCVSERFGAQTDAERTDAQAEEGKLETKIDGWANAAKIAFFAAALASMVFAISSRKMETQDMSEQNIEQQGGTQQSTHQDVQVPDHRHLGGLGKVVDNTTPQPTQPQPQPAEGPSQAEAPKK
jgi:hypothetical protein